MSHPARPLSVVLALIQEHRAACERENVPTDPAKLQALHTEAVGHLPEVLERLEGLESELASNAVVQVRFHQRLEALEAAQADKPAAPAATKKATTRKAG